MRHLLVRSSRALLLVALFTLSAPAQEPSVQDRDVPTRQPRVLVTGDAIVQAQPDTAILTISVVTQSKSALEADLRHISDR